MLSLAARAHVRCCWQPQGCPVSSVLVIKGGGVAISGICLQFTLTPRGGAGGLRFIPGGSGLGLKRHCWQSLHYPGSLSLPLRACGCSLWAGRSSGISSLPQPHSLSLSRGTEWSRFLADKPDLTTRRHWWSQLCPSGSFILEPATGEHS